MQKYMKIINIISIEHIIQYIGHTTEDTSKFGFLLFFFDIFPCVSVNERSRYFELSL
jgi:hypothetical protein